jgi:hypothetical protein
MCWGCMVEIWQDRGAQQKNTRTSATQTLLYSFVEGEVPPLEIIDMRPAVPFEQIISGKTLSILNHGN